MSSIFRIVRTGLVAALAVGGAGWAYERVRLGASEADALARTESELRQRFDASAEALGRMAARLAGERDTVQAAPRDPAAARRLFAAVDAALPETDAGRMGLSIYGPGSAPLAWAGRVSEIPKERLDGPSALFVAPGALGPRLVRVEPILDSDRPAARRRGTIVAEQLLAPVQGALVLAETFIVPTSIVPVSLRLRDDGQAPNRGPYSLAIPSRGGGLLVDAEIDPHALAETRVRWRNRSWAALGSVAALTLLLLAGPLVELRRQTREIRVFALATGGLVATLVAARLIFWAAARLVTGAASLTAPLDLLLHALLGAAIVWIAIDLIERRRVARPRPRLLVPTPASTAWLAGGFALAGASGALLVSAYERFLQLLVLGTSLDLLHFSLHPVSATRLAIAFALVLLHASVVWSVAAAIRLPALVRRTARGSPARAIGALAWVAGAVLATAVARDRMPALPTGPPLLALGAAAACAVVGWRVRARARHASQAVRLAILFLALLVPALAMYPSLLALTTSAREHRIETDYGPQAAGLRDVLRARLYAALEQIDRRPALAELVARHADAVTPTTDRAFAAWSHTDLAVHRLTSAVELYGADGRLVSRFALNLPESPPSLQQPSGCDWDLFDEVSPFGASVRHVLRASRGVCEGGKPLGSVVVRAMLDYRTLPFLLSPNPYLGSLRPVPQTPVESARDRDIELVVYGWSRAPIYSSGPGIWALPGAVFQSLAESRATFWSTLQRSEARFRVYFLNDRGGIYALGFPLITWFGHLVNLAELATLAGVLYLLLLGGSTLLAAQRSGTPASGRALLQEIRSSFYRKLFLAFVAASVVPVLILAFATRTYLAKQLSDSAEEGATKTATVAQRLAEDYATLQQRAPGALQALDDEIMTLIARAIDQDVNLFEGATLQATSQPDLYASGILTKRTPGDVYRGVVLDRLPSFVGVEQVGDAQYLLAAAPVRAGSREGIVTVPLTPRQQGIERQIDELDRRVLFATVLFSLLGAGIGYWMAERIADPVNRLTRATRRIARGDLDARIAATSSDELRRLVEDFNRMAADLKRQHAHIERTQRLEAWAAMARQVAHDIKNPLTPIQLSAEHARRVNIDRGRPLSPVLDECVKTILTQVSLLRQISTEFSSFASSPTPRPEPTRLAEIVEEVVQPYRAPLSDRIAIDVDTQDDMASVLVDRTLFARALTNVIENALHAMPGEGRLTLVAREVPLGTERIAGAATGIVVKVSDTGVGMDPEALARIFEPYFSTKASGTGLGLTIAKRNIELNGGTIVVQSERGKGTTVVITLPSVG